MTSEWRHNFWLRVIILALASTFAFMYVLDGWHPDARFESSDAMWHDSTTHWKGRDFKTVQFDFEEYRNNCHRPSVSLIRTTPMSAWNVVSWGWYLFGPEWKVPWGERRTCLVKRCSTAGFATCDGSDSVPGLMPTSGS